MFSVFAGSTELRLPEKTARKLRGRRVAIVETPEGVLLKPMEDLIAKGKGMLKGRGVSTKAFAALKQEEKELER